MKTHTLILCCFLWFASCITELSAQTISVSDFHVKPDSYEDATASVQKAIEACKNNNAKVLSFPRGRYDFWPSEAIKKEYFVSNTSSEKECPSKIKNVGLLFEDMKNLTIEGNGSLFVFHGKMITWAFDNCENMRLQNVSVDFERPSMSEMTFREVHPGFIIADIHPDSKYEIKDGKLQFYGEGWAMNRFHSILVDTVNGMSRYSSWEPVRNSKVSALAPLTIKLEGDFSQTNYKAGQILTTRDPYRDHVGAFVNLSKNISLENVTMHYMHGLGIVSQFSENLSYKQVYVVPSRNRAIASSADGMHFSGCRGNVLIENCHFKGMHDDPINVHGTYLQIKEIQSPTRLKLRFMHHQTYGFSAFYANDTVAWVTSAAIQSKGTTTVKSARLISEREMEVELADALPKGITVGDCLENLTWTPALTVRNNRFEMTNTRGLLVSTPRKVVIENNTFYRTGMYGILIASDVNSWFESGAATDILIRNNSFVECGFNQGNNGYAISIEPETHSIVPKHWVHRNIRIEDNTFTVSNSLVVRARSVDGLNIQRNKITVSSTPADISALPPAFLLDNCTNTVIRGNDVSSTTLPMRIEYANMKKQEVRTDIKDIRKR